MKLLFILISLVTFGLNARAGESGAHGGDPMKDRIILARTQALDLLRSHVLTKRLTPEQIKKMIQKLTVPDPTVTHADCYDRKLCWYNTDPTKPLPPLKAQLNGKSINVLFSTTPEISSAIQVDLSRAKDMKLSQEEAIVAMLHEAGHAVGISDSLTIDSEVLVLMTVKVRALVTSYWAVHQIFDEIGGVENSCRDEKRWDPSAASRHACFYMGSITGLFDGGLPTNIDLFRGEPAYLEFWHSLNNVMGYCGLRETDFGDHTVKENSCETLMPAMKEFEQKAQAFKAYILDKAQKDVGFFEDDLHW